MTFDFSLLLPKESIKIGQLEIPKYGSLTPLELRQMQDIADLDVLAYRSAIAAILLVSRCGASEPDMDRLPIAVIRQIYDFAINELNEWQAPEGDEKKQQPPTGEISTGDSGLSTPMPSSGDALSTSSENP